MSKKKGKVWAVIIFLSCYSFSNKLIKKRKTFREAKRIDKGKVAYSFYVLNKLTMTVHKKN